MSTTITLELVNKLLEYRDGKLFWKTPRKGVTLGEAGNLSQIGYRRIMINKKILYTHRLVYYIHHGELPKYVDHIDGNPLNNRIENLRAVSHKQNIHNSKRPANNKSGVKGICWDKRRSKWKVELMVSGVKKQIGRFDDLELARLVIEEARNKFHGEFARHE